MRVIIAGGRDYIFTDQDKVDLDRLHGSIGITEVVSGKAPGADTCGEDWANERGVLIKPFPADWNKYRQPGKKNIAGIIRNGEMARYVGMAGAVVLFPGNNGTDDMYKQAFKNKLRIFDWRKDPREFP